MRSHYCGVIDETLIGQSVSLCGWVDTVRLQSHVAFIDLRDHEGIVQIVVERESEAAFAQASQLGYEFCVRVEGSVRRRISANDKLRSGQVEVL